MAWKWQAVCRSCGHEFWALCGQAPRKWTLRCEVCGQDTSAATPDNPTVPPAPAEVHPSLAAERQALEELPLSASPEVVLNRAMGLYHLSDEWIKFHNAVESWFGSVRCHCGGRYLFDAPERCPKCRSVEHQPKEGAFFWHIG